MSTAMSPNVQVPPNNTARKGREPWYYGYCYRMTLILLSLSIIGIVLQAVVGVGITTLVFTPERFGADVNQRVQAEVNQLPKVGPQAVGQVDANWAREMAWTVSNVMVVFWSVLAILWMFYIFGFALIFVDVARWARRYYEQGLRT